MSTSRLPRGSLCAADLRGASFAGEDFTRRDLRRADLSGADLTGAVFVAANLEGTNFTGAALCGAKLLEIPHAARAVFDRADLSRAQMVRVDLSHASLRNAQLNHATLQKVTFDHTDLCGADFRGARLVEWVWKTSHVKGAHFPQDWLQRPAMWSWNDLESELQFCIDHAEQNQAAELWNAVRHIQDRISTPRTAPSPEMIAVSRVAISRIENALRAGTDLPIPAAAPPSSGRNLPRPSCPAEPDAGNLPLPATDELP